MVKLLRSLGWAMVVAAAVVGAGLALGLYQWESVSRADATSREPALAAPSPATASTPVQVQATQAAAQPTKVTAAAPTAAGPTPTPAVMPGARVFAGTCDACHPGATAGLGPALFGPEFTARYPDDGPLKLVIRRGRNAMPSFSTDRLSDSDLDAVVAYLRSLK